MRLMTSHSITPMAVLNKSLRLANHLLPIIIIDIKKLLDSATAACDPDRSDIIIVNVEAQSLTIHCGGYYN